MTNQDDVTQATWHVELPDAGTQGWPKLVAPNGDSIALAAGQGESFRFVAYLNDISDHTTLSRLRATNMQLRAKLQALGVPDADLPNLQD